jgi:hypothetical protein
MPEVDSVDSHILRQPVHVYKTFDPPEGDQYAFIGADYAVRASWQFLVQGESNGTWRYVDEYPRLIAGDNIPKVSVLLAEDIKGRSGVLYPLISQLAGQHMEDASKVLRLHVQGYGKVSMNCRRRQGQSLSNRTDRGEWLMAQACQNTYETPYISTVPIGWLNWQTWGFPPFRTGLPVLSSH